MKAFDLYSGLFSAKYEDRLSSLLVVEEAAASTPSARGSTTLGLTDANTVLDGRLPEKAKDHRIVTAQQTCSDLVANSIVDTELPAFGDLQGAARLEPRPATLGSRSSAC